MKALRLLSLGIVSLALVSATNPIKTNTDTVGIEFFQGTWEEALAKSAEENKPIFMDAYASWCGPCKMLKSRVFTNEQVGAFYNENFINVKVDMEKGYGRKLAQQYRVSAYPSLFFINGDGSVIKKAVGYHNPEQFLGLGRSVLALTGL